MGIGVCKMKKLEVNPLENLNMYKKEVVKFLNQLDLEKVCKLTVSPETDLIYYHTLFRFETKIGNSIDFYYRKNKSITAIRMWDKERNFLGRIALDKNKEDHKREQWLTDIWNQFVDHFNLRIRLLFVNETTPWKWNKEFIY
mgnify:CR=1 FL=1